MKSHILPASALATAWTAFAALAAAQSARVLETPPPRVPRPPLAVPAVPVAVESSAPTDELAARPIDSGARIERSASDRGHVTSLPMSDERWSRVYWDTDEHGTIWVRGRNYKASFGVEGATYYPLFGSDQPRHYPLELSLASATGGGHPLPLAPVTGAVRDGDRVIIDRGGIDEVYEIGVESMEQTFVVEERPQGELKFSVRLETELARRSAEEGFEFSNELGGIRYGRAFARLADGAKLPLTTRPTGSGVQIEMAAEDVATAQFPLVVDPVVSTFDLDATWYDNYDPDIAYDATTDSYLYVYMEFVTSSDIDVFSKHRSGAGTPISEAYVNLSTETMRGASVANSNAYDQFMVVMRDTSRIVGRTTGASSIAYSTQFLIHSGGSPSEVSVGGDPYGAAPSYYCVVWERSSGAGTDFDVVGRLVTNTGSVLGSAPLALGTTSAADWRPKVSKGNNGICWNVVWNRGPAPAPGHAFVVENIYGAQIEWDGSAIRTPAFSIATMPTTYEGTPSVSSPISSGEYVVVWQRDYGDWDILGARVLGGSVLSTFSITGLESEHAGNLFASQKDATVETDGQHFVVAYKEHPIGGPIPRFHMASFALLPGEIRCLEPHIPLSTLDLDTFAAAPAVVSTAASGGAQRRFALAWDEESAIDARNIEGAFFHASTFSTYCYGDGTGTACPCGNNGTAGRGCASSVSTSGALLTAVGTSDVSADNVQLRAIGMPSVTTCLFFQGTTSGSNAGLGATFGDGLRCTGGSTIRLATKTTALGVGVFPQTGDPSISVRGSVPAAGGVRFYQSWYRNSAAFCTASTFNLTNGARVVWLP